MRSQLIQLRFILLSLIAALVVMACKKTSPATLKLGPVADDQAPCQHLSDDDARGSCERVYLSLLQEQTKGSYGNIVIEYDQRFMGDPMTLSIDGECLALADGKVVSQACKDYDENFKWHFVDVEIEYTWGNGVKFYDLAFHAVTRASMKRWHQHDKNIMPTPKLECLDFYDAARPYMDFRLAKLKIVPCEESKLMFMTVPNDTVGDRNLYGSRWTRVLAIDTRLPQYAGLKTAMLDLNPMLTKPCAPGCTSDSALMDVVNNAKRVDLGEIKWSKDTFVLYRADFDVESRQEAPHFALLSGDFVGKQAAKLCTEDDPCTDRKDNIENEIFVGGCVPHRSDGEERCFSDERLPLTTYKMLYHAVSEKKRGNVVQLRPENDRCLLWNGEIRNCSTSKEIDKPDGDDASQYRLAIVKAPRGKTEAYAQLQRVFPESSQNDTLCYDLFTKTAAPCCVDADHCPGTYAYMLNWPTNANMPNLVFRDQRTNADQVMPLQICQTATNTKQFLAYDCVDYVAPIWNVLKNIAEIVFWIPELGTIPSFIIQSILCESGEQTIAADACREVAIQAITGFTDVLLDNFTVTSLTTVLVRKAIEKRAVKASAGVVADLARSPALATVVRDVVKRTAQAFSMSVAADALNATLTSSLPEVAQAIIKTALVQGVNGGSLTTAYTSQSIDAMIQSAVNEALTQSIKDQPASTP